MIENSNWSDLKMLVVYESLYSSDWISYQSLSYKMNIGPLFRALKVKNDRPLMINNWNWLKLVLYAFTHPPKYLTILLGSCVGPNFDIASGQHYLFFINSITLCCPSNWYMVWPFKMITPLRSMQWARYPLPYFSKSYTSFFFQSYTSTGSLYYYQTAMYVGCPQREGLMKPAKVSHFPKKIPNEYTKIWQL